ncbi:inner centromere protein [Microdochium nivale]|nr:inner centromere protein [Microdochium nivale]
MGGSRAVRLSVGSSQWIAEERTSAQQIEQTEVEEFTFSARNEFDWLHEHMADIFSDNQVNVAEIFKTPGKLRGKTPRTVRKIDQMLENRAPLADIFSSSPKRVTSTAPLEAPTHSATPDIFIRADSQVSPTRPDVALSFNAGVQAQPVAPKPFSVIDSGYHGSQSQDTVAIDDASITFSDPVFESTPATDKASKPGRVAFQNSPEQANWVASDSPEHPVEAATESTTSQYFTADGPADMFSAKTAAGAESTTPTGSPVREAEASSSPRSLPSKTPQVQTLAAPVQTLDHDPVDNPLDEASGSPSDGSSPIRPLPRKSSLTFASLPARQPMAHKSIGGHQTTRTSYIGQNRNSYYNRHTGGKSLGRARHELTDDENEDEDMDDATTHGAGHGQIDSAVAHNKTQTQRLQDQINMLGQAAQNTSKPQKSSTGATIVPPPQTNATLVQSLPPTKQRSPPKKPTTPGAFPEDDDDVEEDDWMEALDSPDDASKALSPRPILPKYHSADVMESVAGKDTAGGDIFGTSRMREESIPPPVPPKPSNPSGHHKSASVSVLPHNMSRVDGDDTNRLKKTISASTTNLGIVSEDGRPATPSKSPSRSFKDSPMRSVKKTLGSLFGRAKELAASSEAISVKSKTSMLSTSTLKLGLHATPSTESLWRLGKDLQMYPDLSKHVEDAASIAPASPTRTEGHRTRASLDREKAEEKRKEKEAKEARRVAEQMAKLDKAREQEREKARVYSQEQDRLTAVEEQLALQKQQDKQVISQATAPAPIQTQNSTWSSPRKARTEGEETRDVDMADVPGLMPPPSVPRSVAPAPAPRTREIKRPTRPDTAKTRQQPTVIRVNTGSQHTQLYPSNNSLATGLYDTLSTVSQPHTESRIGQPSSHKPSLQSMSSSTSSAAAGKPKALTAAAKKKEQEEREAQRRREAKAELDRKRAAQEEEKRQEQQKRLELERQREEERRQAEMKKNAQRLAIEKAKQTRAPPPAKRNAPATQAEQAQKAETGGPRPPSRMAPSSARSQEDLGRSIHNAPKPAQKRQQPANDTRSGPASQSSDAKRMRMTNDYDNEGEVENQSRLKGAPVRPSGGFKKDVPSKSAFPSGYANAPPSATRDLFRPAVATQHSQQSKGIHPLDLAHVSKGAIPFAPNPNVPGTAHKTPARPLAYAVAKSVIKSSAKPSPRFQNGENIELPEINTDDEDSEYEDSRKGMTASWADSSPLIKGLIDQESMNPFLVFGPPAPLNMEEVFAKSKDRFHKFRQRTSSANWSGADRLTEDEVRRDMAAREKMRRDGAWSYEMSRDLA